MGPDLHAADLPGAGTPLRCPACSASVRPGAPWCTQCYAALAAPGTAAGVAPGTPAAAAPAAGPAAPAAAAPTAAPSPAPVPPPPAAPRALPGDAPTWPCASCGAVNAISADACATCGAGFLAALRATEEPLLVLPVVGDVGALSRAQRLGLAAGVVLLVVLLTALLGFLLS